MVKIGIIPTRLLRYRQTKKSWKSALFLWQRWKDSNPYKQSQSLVCYPYTTPLCIKLTWTLEDCLSNVSQKILSYFTSLKIWLFWAICGHFGIKIRLENRCFQACGRGIRTLPICKIVDFEWVPNNLVTRLARNNDSVNP